MIYDINGNVLSANDARLVGKKLAAIGDSYVSGVRGNQEADMWWYKIAERNSMTVTALGVGGESLRVMVQTERYKNIPANSDYICVLSGNNDTSYDYTPIGTNTDTENTTFYGCLDILCKWLMQNRPTARKLFITPMHRSNTVDYIPYINAIKEVCYRYSIPCWDSYGGLDILINGASGVTQSIFETTNPGVHLNALGQDYLSYKVEEQLKML